MRRFLTTLTAASVALIAAAGPAAADVQRLSIKDPGWVSGASPCGSGPVACDLSNFATIELSIKCPVGESYTLLVSVKQDGGDSQGSTQTGGDCTGDASRRYVNVTPSSGSFHPGGAKVKASASSSPGAGAGASSVFQANTDRKITLVEGSPPCC